jgi:sugar phosphate isomerase/epimerase
MNARKKEPLHEASIEPALRGRLPFRLGTTSYIIPDDILPNLRHLCRRVDDIELVLFESDEFSNLPPPADVAEMGRLAAAHGLSFTIHLPLDAHTGSADETERAEAVGKCRRVMELTKTLDPFAWILHLPGDRRGEPPTDDPTRWFFNHRKSLQELLVDGPAPSRICVETLDYDFNRVAPLVEEFNLSVCLDIGHLLVMGRDVAAHLDWWFERARVFHVHGVDQNGKDHVSLRHFSESLLEDLADRLSRLPSRDSRVMTMEIFGEDDFEESIRVVEERLKPWLR